MDENNEGAVASLTKRNWHGGNVGMFRSEENEERGKGDGLRGG